MSRPPKLTVLVNPAPVTSGGFLARLTRCHAELTPVLDRLARRHGCEILLAALVAEIEEGSATLWRGGRLSRKAIDGVIERLRNIPTR